MPNFQVRLSCQVNEMADKMAEEMNVSKADIIRKGIQIFNKIYEARKKDEELAIINKAGEIEKVWII